MVEQPPRSSLRVEATPSTTSSYAHQSLETWWCHWQHDTNVQIFADVNVTLLEIVKRNVVDSAGRNAKKLSGKNTRATETFGADRDDVSVREHVGLLFVETFRNRF